MRGRFFTVRLAGRLARFELADKGNALPRTNWRNSAGMQPKLLRVLQEQEFERLAVTAHQSDRCAAGGSD